MRVAQTLQVGVYLTVCDNANITALYKDLVDYMEARS